jgi:hypothetical protein
LFANTYYYRMTSTRAWPLPAPGTLDVGAASAGTIALDIAVPDTAAPGEVMLSLTVHDTKAVLRDSCRFMVISPELLAVGETPLPFALRPVAPNPARGTARLEYSLPRAAALRLRIYGLRGEQVRSVVDGVRPAGLQSVVWDGRDDRGVPVPSGAYYVRLEAGGESRSKLLKPLGFLAFRNVRVHPFTSHVVTAHSSRAARNSHKPGSGLGIFPTAADRVVRCAMQ